MIHTIERIGRISQFASEIISEYEGNHRLIRDGTFVEAYWDPNGRVWTIGRGLTGPDITKGTTWPIDYAEARFRRRLGYLVEEVLKMVTVVLTDRQLAALTSFAYNVGLDDDTDEIPEGLGDSTLLKKVNAGDWEGAANEFSKWDKAWDPVTKTRKPLAGLIRRRAAEAAMFRRG